MHVIRHGWMTWYIGFTENLLNYYFIYKIKLFKLQIGQILLSEIKLLFHSTSVEQKIKNEQSQSAGPLFCCHINYVSINQIYNTLQWNKQGNVKIKDTAAFSVIKYECSIYLITEWNYTNVPLRRIISHARCIY